MKHLQITARATVVAAVLALVAGCSRPAGKGGRESSAVDGMRNEAVVRTTPVKNQGRSPLCWLYAMLATIESEHLMAGDSVNLSTDYLARQLLADQARTYFLTRRTADVSLRGMASMALQLLQRYGAEDHDAYGNRQPVNYDVLARKVRQVARGAGSVARLDGRLESLLDRETGYVPRAVFMFGAEYTPHEFAHSVCLPGEYLAVTSFTHHPFGRAFVLEVPDNQLRDSFLNVPIGVMMRHVERALRAGHPVCWEGDVSEPGFCFADGIATMPRRVDGASAQALRQRDFEARRTTDDHCMELCGLARDSRGRRYYLAKNSWGTGNALGGYMYLSEDYVRLKTVAVYMSRRAWGWGNRPVARPAARDFSGPEPAPLKK